MTLQEELRQLAGAFEENSMYHHTLDTREEEDRAAIVMRAAADRLDKLDSRPDQPFIGQR